MARQSKKPKTTRQRRKILKPKTRNQETYMQSINKSDVTFCSGPAGSGKTSVSVGMACEYLIEKKVDKIIITRPTVSTEDNGFLPGSEKEKMEPWLVPIRSNMRKIYNKPLILEKMEKEENIELVSLAHFRGRTFENSVVIVDEFQNLTRSQMRMALGRLGKGSTMIFCGDNQQIDLKDKNYSAIVDLPKITDSQFVYKKILTDNHRHEAIDEVFDLLMGM